MDALKCGYNDVLYLCPDPAGRHSPDAYGVIAEAGSWSFTSHAGVALERLSALAKLETWTR